MGMDFRRLRRCQKESVETGKNCFSASGGESSAGTSLGGA